MRLSDEQIRMALFEGAEKLITASKLRLARHELGVGRMSEIFVAEIQKMIRTLSGLQANLLQRISPPSPDIRNR